MIPPRWLDPLPRGPELWNEDLAHRWGWTADTTDGIHVTRLAAEYVRLTKGDQRGERIALRAWQGHAICDMLRLREDGRRQYQVYCLWVPRKNSKSLLGSILALDGLFDEPGAEVYSCAGTKDQARLIFKEVKSYVEMSPELSKTLKVYKTEIVCPELGSLYKVLSREAMAAEGLNPSRVLFDETHVQPDDELWSVMNLGSGTRDRPLVLSMSTFGVRYVKDQDSLAYRLWRYGEMVKAGEIDDPTFGHLSYHASQSLGAARTDTAGVVGPGGVGAAEPEVKYTDPNQWVLANPALGDFLRESDMERVVKQMTRNQFCIKRLNVWVASAESWLPEGLAVGRVDKSRNDEAGAHGKRVVLMCDGSWANDSTALVAATVEEIPHVFVVKVWAKPPETQDPNWRVPMDEVEATIREYCDWFEVVEVGFDPYRWQRTMQDLVQQGLPVVEYPMGQAARMVKACKGFLDGLADSRFTLDGHPTLLRHLENCKAKTDQLGTRIVKESPGSTNKIDAAVCAVAALERAQWHHAHPPKKPRPFARFR